MTSQEETGFSVIEIHFVEEFLLGFSVAAAQVLLKVNNTICQVLLANKWNIERYEYYRGKNINLSNRYPKYCQICSGFSSAVFVLECVKCPKNQVDFRKDGDCQTCRGPASFTGGA